MLELNEICVLKDNLKGSLAVVYQISDLAQVESFWGSYLGQENGVYRFHSNQNKHYYPRGYRKGHKEDNCEISLDLSKITRVMNSEGRLHKTVWKKDMGLEESVQAFYNSLSDACDVYCSGYAGVDVRVFFKDSEKKSLYGKISHEKLDEGIIEAKRGKNPSFTLDSMDCIMVFPIEWIEKVMIYSWPNGAMGGRNEEVGWQT